MFLDEVGEVVDMFRNGFPLTILYFIPILIIISPVCHVSAAHDFAVYRMQQYDLQGSTHGCRNTLISVEARAISASSFTRRCVVARLKEFTIDKFKEMTSSNAAGLLLLLPVDLQAMSKEEKEHLLEIEQDLLEEETQLPVYFSHETPELLEMYNSIQQFGNMDHASSAFEALFSSATANGFQLLVSGPQSKALSDYQIVNIQGKLGGNGIEEQLPTVAIVSHYDSFGIAPSLSFGSDSNGSGVVALLELARLFSKLYMNSRNHAKYNLLFLLTGAGKFNFQGTKRWLDDQFESGEGGLMNDVSYVLCLDTIGSGDDLYLHVSKPPGDGSAGSTLLQNLELVSGEQHGEMTFKMVHKKINLAEDYLAWEHERFSIRRLPAYTLSHLESYRSPARNTILDTRQVVDVKALTRNIRVVAESLARHIYNITNVSSSNVKVFGNGLDVEEEVVSAWIDHLSKTPRAAQLLTKDSPEVATLEQALNKHLKDVRRHVVKADKRDPEFVFYSGAEFMMNAYNVKPAVFDLFLALGIGAYLCALYYIVQNFHIVYQLMKRFSTAIAPSKKTQ